MIKLNKKGFTLVELLAVIVVITLVLGLSSYGIINAYRSSKEKSIVISEESIFESARILSSEAEDYKWHRVDDNDVFCTSIQQLKNNGLLKKNANTGNINEESYIYVSRDKTNFSINNVAVVDKDSEIYNICSSVIRRYHISYIAEGATNVPSSQLIEVEKENDEDEVCMENYSVSSLVPKKKGYIFSGWGLTNEDSEEPQYNPSDLITVCSDITLYAKWNPAHTITFLFNVGNDVTIDSPTNKTYYWSINNNLIERSIANKNNYTSRFFTKYYGETINLPDYNNKDYINIKRTGYAPVEGNEWYKIIVDQNQGEQKKYYNQSEKYTFEDFCENTNNNCEVILYINWTDSSVQPPSFETNPSGKSQRTWYNTDYGLIISATTSGASIKYRINNESNYNEYNGEISVREGKTIYTAYAEKDGISSAEVSWEAYLDKTDPILSLINTSGGNWTNNNVTISLVGSDGLSGIDHYEYKEKDTNNPWTRCNSDITFSTEQNKLLSFRVVDKAGNYSNVIDTWVKIDRTAPNISFDMYNGNSTTAFDLANKPYYSNVSTNTDLDDLIWLNNSIITADNITLKWTVNDSASGVNYSDATFSYNKAFQDSLNTSISNTKDVSGHQQQNNNHIFTETIGSGGYRYVYLNVCDNAGNCKKSEVYFKFDNTPPSVSFSMKNGAITIANNNQYYYEGKEGNSLIWLNYSPTLMWSVTDDASGSVDKATFKYNRPYQDYNSSDSEQSGSLIDEVNKKFLYDLYKETKLDGTSTNSGYNFSRRIDSYGNRYMTFEICDLANNCTTKEVNFKFDTETPNLEYTGYSSSRINYTCRSTISGIQELKSTDNNGGLSAASMIDYESPNDLSNTHYWSNPYPDITITCTNRAGNIDTMTISKIKLTTTSNTSYSYCGYDIRYYYVGDLQGSSTTNKCNTTATDCGGIQKYQKCSSVSLSNCGLSKCKPGGTSCACIRYYDYSVKSGSRTQSINKNYIKVSHNGIEDYYDLP